MSKNNPCYKCEDRQPLCHSTCSDYLAFKEKLNKVAEAKRKYNEELSYYIKSKKKR